MDLDHDTCYRAICRRDARWDGRFFVGVRTTRIYCRPICPARTPLSSNVTFFRSAPAAQSAGFRACLRCRPEMAPDLGAWRGPSTVVSRALVLIDHGALGGAGVETLAHRLGLDGRQLRRLFGRHLGASPAMVAATRRILLAKQLVQDTRMPMAEVAAAAGFVNVRRFNDTLRSQFGRPPIALRRSRGPELSAGPQGLITLLLPYRPPYDWPAMLQFLHRRAIPGIEVVEADRYRRSITLDGVQGTFSVEPAGTDALRACIRFPKLSVLPAIVARLRRLFDLAADPSFLESHFRDDPIMAPLIAARPGLRIPGAWDGFELAVRAVLGQQITVSGAVTLAGRMVAAHGEALGTPADGLTHVFPRPETLASAGLGPLGMPRSRAVALSAVAAAARDDPHVFDAAASLEAAVARLRSIRGIGEWTAHYIALRHMRETDAFPASDVGLMRAIARREGRPYGAAELLERAKAWRPFRAYAAQHLWQAD